MCVTDRDDQGNCSDKMFQHETLNAKMSTESKVKCVLKKKASDY